MTMLCFLPFHPQKIESRMDSMKNSQNHSRIKIAALVAFSLASLATSTPIDISESNLDSHSNSCLELISISATTSSKNAQSIQHLGNHQTIQDGILSSNHPLTSFQLINNRAISSHYEAFNQSKFDFMNQNQNDELSRNIFDCWSRSDGEVEKLHNDNHLQDDFYQDPISNHLLTFQKRSQSSHQVLTRYDPQSELSTGRDFLILVTRDDSAESFDQIKGIQSPIFDFIKSSSQSSLDIIETNSGNISWADHLLMINEDDESSKLKRLFNYLEIRIRNKIMTLEDESSLNQLQKDLVEMKKGVRILSIGDDGNQAILSVSSTSLLNLDKVLRRDSRMTLLTSHSDSIRNLKKKESALTQIENEDGEDKKPNPHYPNPKFNPLIESLINSPSFSIENFRKDVETLSGENQKELIAEGREGWTSRHSGTWGGRKAGEWLLDEMTSYLKPLHGSFCRFQTHTYGFNPNIICEIPGVDDDDWLKSKSEEGEEEGMILISAHQDSRGTFGSTHAGGADDDGSGTSAILAIARALGRRPIRFSRTVRLVLFTGEEQGLVGSKAYAKELRERGEKIRFMLQIDMIAYRKQGEPIQLATPDLLATQSATGLVRKIAGIYQPELQVGFTPACCSDHQSFWEELFPATWIFERNGPIADPMYHNSGDLSRREGYSYEQLQASTKVVFATLLNVAGFYL